MFFQIQVYLSINLQNLIIKINVIFYLIFIQTFYNQHYFILYQFIFPYLYINFIIKKIIKLKKIFL
jgi:hypothetical protein